MDKPLLALHPPDPRIPIRPVLGEDVDLLHQRCFPDKPIAELHQLVYRAQQNAHQGRGVGVVVTGRDKQDVLGFGQLTLWNKLAEISDLNVMEAYRHRGMGTALIQYLVRAAREMHIPGVEIGVARSNTRALALYHRLGFMDAYPMLLDLGRGEELVLYLRLDLQ